MTKSSIRVLQAVVVVVGLGALAFMLLEPLFEGRNVNATLSQTYFNDLFLTCVYIASIPFFVALYQVVILLGYIGRQEIFSLNAIRAVRTIKQCTYILVTCVLIAEAYLGIVRPGDDIAGGVFMGLLMIFVFGVSGIVATVCERTLHTAVRMKSENDLTI
jgi:hypothetical protein